MTKSDEIPRLPEELLRSLDAWNSRKKYQDIDQNTFQEIAKSEWAQAILDVIDHRIGKNWSLAKEIVLGLPRCFQIVYITWILEAEVMNGGLNQFFWNPSCEFAELASPALRELGAIEASTIFDHALELAIREIPEIAHLRKLNTLEAFSELYSHTALNDLDEPFGRLAERLPEYRERYIEVNAASFITKPGT